MPMALRAFGGTSAMRNGEACRLRTGATAQNRAFLPPGCIGDRTGKRACAFIDRKARIGRGCLLPGPTVERCREDEATAAGPERSRSRERTCPSGGALVRAGRGSGWGLDDRSGPADPGRADSVTVVVAPLCGQCLGPARHRQDRKRNRPRQAISKVKRRHGHSPRGRACRPLRICQPRRNAGMKASLRSEFSAWFCTRSCAGLCADRVGRKWAGGDSRVGTPGLPRPIVGDVPREWWLSPGAVVIGGFPAFGPDWPCIRYTGSECSPRGPRPVP